MNDFLYLFNWITIFFYDQDEERLNEVPDHDEIKSQEESQGSPCFCQEWRCWVDKDFLWHCHAVGGEAKGQSCDVLRTCQKYRILKMRWLLIQMSSFVLKPASILIIPEKILKLTFNVNIQTCVLTYSVYVQGRAHPVSLFLFLKISNYFFIGGYFEIPGHFLQWRSS